MNDDLTFNYLRKDYDEKQLIDLIIRNIDGTLNISLFKNLLTNPFDSRLSENYKGCYITTNVLRNKLGFSNIGKPGDFDIIVIPYSIHKIYFERTIALEVKIVRPTRKNALRNANSMGVTQVWGLINDGFPLVGIIHLCLTEPLKDEEKTKIKYMGKIGGDSTEVITNEDDMPIVLYDSFSSWSMKKQMQRLISTDLPKYVGLLTVGINTKLDSKLQMTFDMYHLSNFESGYFNPKKSQETIKKVKSYFSLNQDIFIDAKKNSSH